MKEDKTLDYWINAAREIAISAHEGQFRRDGKTPYIRHPEQVAKNVEKRLQPIAWLHDVVEDTTVSLEDLKIAQFPQYIIDAVDLLTHRSSEPNVIYWKRMLQNRDAVTVKIADIKANLKDSPTERQAEKYRRALKLFADAGYSVE